MLMDDMLEVPDGEPVGGPHPHAGFETVTLILEGKLGDSIEGLSTGDFQMMTAGKGIIHTESIAPRTKVRILQLWLTLPKSKRWTTPRVQSLHFENVPKISKDGLDIRVYSGSFGGVSSPVLNYTPVIIADIQLDPAASTVQLIPAASNTFLYGIEGSVDVGQEKKSLQQGQVGWLDRLSGDSQSELSLAGGKSGGRLILYSAQPQHDPIVSYGPFIGDQQQDIVRLYEEYRAGQMKHVSVLPEPQVLNY
jgi:redox-sensitive bicupin YhaK (pirin superfamily)